MYNVRKMEENINICGDFKGKILYNEPMAEKTTFKVGGSAAVVIEPADIDSLVIAVRAAHKSNVPYICLGGGSNVVVPDEGIEYAVILTTGLDSITVVPDKDGSGNCRIRCGAGCPMRQIIDYCTAEGLSGMEPFAGLPGTAGGAAFMNARCYEKSMDNVLIAVEYLSPGDCCLHHYDMNPTDWAYKKSPFQDMEPGTIIVCVEIAVKKVTPDDIPEIQKQCQFYIDDRIRKGHFTFPSAGSVFKNNRAFGCPTGKIIDTAGLRGLEVGGAQIAPWHGNFIINRGNATAADIRQITQIVTETVYKKNGFSLELEIIFLPSTK